MGVEMYITVLLALFGSAHAGVNREESHWNAIIEKVNGAQTTWVAARSFSPEFDKKEMKRLLGARFDEPYVGPVKTFDDFEERVVIPPEFDSRKKWPYCESIGHIRDQSYCGSCWAASTAAALTDRFCIATKGKYKPALSMEDILSCCNECGYGCEGGYMWKAWTYFKTTGIVTGGDHDSHEGCKPYSLKPCEHHNNGTKPQCFHYGDLATPSCTRRCTNSRHIHSFSDDHHKVKSIYALRGVKAIQREIMENGPVEAGFDTYEDFVMYKSGIYRHITGELHGGHAIKIIGWGSENGTPYWLIANSWNENWGENGYFRMLRGSNECGIEDSVMGGIPKVEKKHLLHGIKLKRHLN